MWFQRPSSENMKLPVSTYSGSCIDHTRNLESSPLNSTSFQYFLKVTTNTQESLSLLPTFRTQRSFSANKSMSPTFYTKYAISMFITYNDRNLRTCDRDLLEQQRHLRLNYSQHSHRYCPCNVE